MATITKTTKRELKMTTVEVPVITLELTEEEALNVAGVLGRVTGSGKFSTYNVYSKMVDVLGSSKVVQAYQRVTGTVNVSDRRPVTIF